ncbi:MAG: hypothetical protein GY786_11165 [Proteobacteria bacterium]|nr:hypothetical protein [Pseudomonadota bacterium]
MTQHRIKEFHQNHDLSYVSNQASKEHLLEKLAILEGDRETKLQQQQEFESRKDKLIIEVVHAQTEMESYAQRMINLDIERSALSSANVDLSLSEESLEQDYLIKLKAYDNSLTESGLEGLKASLNEVRKQKIQADKDYGRDLADNDPEKVTKLALQEKKDLIRMKEIAREDTDLAQQTGGLITGELRSLEKEHDLFLKNRIFPGLVKGRSDRNLAQLEQAEAEVEEKILGFRSALQGLADQLYEKERSLNHLAADLNKIEMLRKFIQEYSEQPLSAGLEIPEVSQNLDELENQIETCREAILLNKNHYDQARQKAEISFDQVRRYVQTEEFRQEENRLSIEIGNNPFLDICAHVENHLKLTDDRIEALTHEIQGTQEDLDLCVGHLQNHVSEALKKLRFVMKKSVIPKDVPYVGGKKILKMKNDLSSVNKEQRTTQITAYVQELAETQLVPNVGSETGDELTAALIVAIGKSKNRTGEMGIEIIKLSKIVDYSPINKIKGSGGESMTSALLLYLVIAQLRASSRAGAKNAIGGFLLMDNPFSRATTPQLVKSQVDLAKELGFQLIYATAIKDFNAQALFSHFVQLRQVAYDRTHDRVHVNRVESAEFTTLKDITASSINVEEDGVR